MRNIKRDDFNDKNFTANDKDTFEKSAESKINAISFFSGAGGLDIGAQLAGVNVISSLDFDKDSVETMRSNKIFKNSTHFHEDIRNVYGSNYSNILKENSSDKLILIGGPPCQPFSKAGYWANNRLGDKDPRNMIGEYLRIISELLPDGFLLENVESILHPKNKIAVEQIQEFADLLGYNLIVYRANALDFGVPQKRKRVFFIGTRKKIKGEPQKTHGSQLEIFAKNDVKPYEKVVNWIGKYDEEKYFEKEELTIGKTYDEALKMIPPGENYFALTERNGNPNPMFKANTRFWNFLLKLHPELPSWTIAAQPGPWVGPFHWNDRRLRVPEIAAIQTFPEDYIFKGSRRSIHKQIGNAVPPLLGKSMVEFLIKNI
ncbi:DNA cytosine methyltransferase [Chryseobacterium binzhouense]|uniref:DNA cytosine methyltransferase n=1 Tax=Chryseobacterium binzhouense TaxID=2593646 RepID=UPI00117D43AE|nr:DNA cytosine methyltransferase [Chryseobacterium binzhouense]